MGMEKQKAKTGPKKKVFSFFASKEPVLLILFSLLIT